MTYVGEIRCNDWTNFMDMIYDLTTRGLHFRAETETLVIYLTGGH